MNPPRLHTKNRATWEFIKERKGEEEAQRIYEQHLISKREGTNEDEEIYWRQIEKHLHRGGKSPHDEHRCLWCGSEVAFESVQADQVYCPDPHPYMDRRICTVDMGRSTKKAISTIEFIWKIIEQRYKCVSCGNRFQPNQMEQGHVIARNHGGPDEFDNIKVVCNTCNKIMHDKNMTDFIESGSKGAWKHMEGLSKDQAIRNLLRYCHDLKIELRCKAIVQGVLTPHGTHEEECSTLVLAWIQKHASPFMLATRTYPTEPHPADTSPDYQACA